MIDTTLIIFDLIYVIHKNNTGILQKNNLIVTMMMIHIYTKSYVKYQYKLLNTGLFSSLLLLENPYC